MKANPFWLQRNHSFAARVERALTTLRDKNSEIVLEGRSKSVGASEINMCPRRVVKSKTATVKHGFYERSKFFRGHRQEEFNAPIHRKIAMEDGIYWIPQLRLYHPTIKGLRAHLDNVYFDSPTGNIKDARFICTVEEKSAKELSGEPLDDYIAQIHYQLGLLHLNYRKAVCCGYLYQTDLNGDHTDFGQQIEQNLEISEKLFGRGKVLLEWINSGEIPDPEPSMKCTNFKCPFIEDCPAWKNPENPPVNSDVLAKVRRYEDIKQEIKALEKERQILKGKITDFFSGLGKQFFRGEVSPGCYVKISNYQGRLTCNIKDLEIDYPHIAAKYVKKGQDSVALNIDVRNPSSPN